jgi:TonB family protein
MQTSGRKPGRILARAALFLLVAAGSAAAQEVGSSRKVVKLVSAEYPAILKQRGIGGSVRMRVVVTPSGSVKDVQVMGGNPILAECAVKAVKQWMFNAAEKEETVDVTLGFNPHSPNN